MAEVELQVCEPTSSSGQEAAVRDALQKIFIANSDDVRGNVWLPTTLESVPEAVVTWKSSAPNVISEHDEGKIAAGVVTRPSVGSTPVKVKLTATVAIRPVAESPAIAESSLVISRDFVVTVHPAVRLAQYSRYGMVNFARSNSAAGQQIYMAYSVGNDATNWHACAGGKAILTSTKGMHGVRDPSIVRSHEGDKFFLVATDLNVDARDHGWQGWDWAQSGASLYLEVWESNDLIVWSEQRHIRVSSPEAGMTFAPEAIWDPEIGAYVVYWTSSMYPAGSRYTPDRADPRGRYPLTRNQTLYATTRDFVHFTPAQVMSGRPGHGTLDAVIVKNDKDGMYHRFVCDRTSTGVQVKPYIAGALVDDIYQERARSVLAPAEDWELVAGSITHRLKGTTYAEAPLAVIANPGDVHGAGCYMFADQIWADAPAGRPMEEQLHPYWTHDLSSGEWQSLEWKQKADYEGALGIIRHGTIFGLTSAEHAVLREAQITSLSIRSLPARTTYLKAEAVDLAGLRVAASYDDGVVDEEVSEGYGGYVLSGINEGDTGVSTSPTTRTVMVSMTVKATTQTTSFEIHFQE